MRGPRLKKKSGRQLSVSALLSFKTAGNHQRLPTAAKRLAPNGSKRPAASTTGLCPAYGACANSVPWPAAGHMLMTDILAVYTTPGYGKNTRIGDVRSILDVYGFTNRGRSWERGSLRLYPPEHFPQSQEGCIRSFNGLKTYLDSALAEASPSHP